MDKNELNFDYLFEAIRQEIESLPKDERFFKGALIACILTAMAGDIRAFLEDLYTAGQARGLTAEEAVSCEKTLRRSYYHQEQTKILN